MFDVVVIGGGAAGAAAALSAAGAGARVALVRRGPGAAALGSGAWHDAPPLELRDALRAAGHELVDCDGPLPHPDGVLVHCAAAGASHANAALRAGASRVVVCGIAGLPAFRATSLAALWSDEAGLSNDEVRPAMLTVDRTPAAGWSAPALGGLLEREPERLISPLREVVRTHQPQCVILPAVLGLSDHARVREAVADGAGIVIGEALGVAPSLPGWRLDRALMQVVAAAGVQIVAGSVVSCSTGDGGVHRLTIDARRGAADAGTMTVGAGAFVLATGKYIGGGITADAEFEEPALGCDVALERFARTIDDPGAALVLTDPVRTEPQPVLGAGVRVDADGHPLTPAGEVFLSNVFVAGSVRAGVEAAVLGLGAAAHDGHDAGLRAAKLASAAGR